MSLVMFTRTAFALLVVLTLEVACKRASSLDHRVANMKSLLSLLSQNHFTNTEISQLLLDADNRGVKLHSLKPKDPMKPCYRVVSSESNDPASVVLEETENVDDAAFVVRAYLDGSIVVERK